MTHPKLEELLKNYSDHGIDVCSKYAEPGYTDPENGVIILANWNGVPEETGGALEEEGHELEWCDEWVIDYENDRCFRSSPTHHGWTPSFLLNDWTNGEVIGHDEILEDPADYIEEYLLNDPRVAAFEDLPDRALEDQGFNKLDGDHFENGFHVGQTDDPRKIYAEHSDGNDVVFRLEGVGQFDVHFSAWLRKREE